MFKARIDIDPEIKHGKLVINGTRVPVDAILRSLAGRMGMKDITEEYGIQKDDVLAAIEYAAKIVAKEEIKVYA